MEIPRVECRRLFEHDKFLRFGLAHLQGSGPTVFLARLIPRTEFGSDDPGHRRRMYFTTHDMPGFMHLCDRKGNHASSSDWDGMVPAVFAWPGQSHGNDCVVSGNFVSMLMHHAKPKYVVETEKREAVASGGRDQDRLVKDQAYEMRDYHKHLLKKHSFDDPLWNKEDTMKGLKKKENEGFLRTLENDKSDSFEAEALKNAGLA